MISHAHLKTGISHPCHCLCRGMDLPRVTCRARKARGCAARPKVLTPERRLVNHAGTLPDVPGVTRTPPLPRSDKGEMMAGRSISLQLWQEIALVLALKIALLATIWAVWFSDPESRAVDERKIASQIYSTTTQKEPDHGAVPGTR